MDVRVVLTIVPVHRLHREQGGRNDGAGADPEVGRCLLCSCRAGDRGQGAGQGRCKCRLVLLALPSPWLELHARQDNPAAHVGDVSRLLGGGCIVQVHQGPPVHLLVQDRKIRPERRACGLRREPHGWSEPATHTHTHTTGGRQETHRGNAPAPCRWGPTWRDPAPGQRRRTHASPGAGAERPLRPAPGRRPAKRTQDLFLSKGGKTCGKRGVANSCYVACNGFPRKPGRLACLDDQCCIAERALARGTIRVPSREMLGTQARMAKEIETLAICASKRRIGLRPCAQIEESATQKDGGP